MIRPAVETSLSLNQCFNRRSFLLSLVFKSDSWSVIFIILLVTVFIFYSRLMVWEEHPPHLYSLTHISLICSTFLNFLSETKAPADDRPFRFCHRFKAREPAGALGLSWAGGVRQRSGQLQAAGQDRTGQDIITRFARDSPLQRILDFFHISKLMCQRTWVFLW